MEKCCITSRIATTKDDKLITSTYKKKKYPVTCITRHEVGENVISIEYGFIDENYNYHKVKTPKNVKPVSKDELPYLSIGPTYFT